MLRKVSFIYFGRSWGDSLFITCHGQQLPDVGEVIGNMIMIKNLTKLGDWRRELVNRSIEQMNLNKTDIPLYLTQVMDLGDSEAGRMLWLKMGDAILEMDEKALMGGDVWYEKLAGLSFWEMEASYIMWFLIDYYKFWKQQKQEGRASDVLLAAKSNLKNLANVVINKGLIHKGESIRVDDGMMLSYEEIVNLLMFLS